MRHIAALTWMVGFGMLVPTLLTAQPWADPSHAAEGKKYRNVRILGLMGMATLTDDEAVIRSDFSKLISMRDEIRSDKGLAGGLPENFGLLSFGMTHDYKIAVAMGADIVRIGTLIFGQRI